jgi:hypothetical protein
MSRWLTWPETPSLLLLVLFTASLMAGFIFFFQLLNRSLAPYDIVAFELAWTPARAGQMMRAWAEAGNAAARQSLWIDFAFMPAYALSFAGLTLLAGRATSGRMQMVGLWLTLAPFAAWALDAVENLSLLNTLDNATNPSASVLTLAGAAATIKFLLLLVCMLYWLSALVYRVRRRVR